RRLLADGTVLYERLDRPYRRYRLHMPWEAVYRLFLKGMFYEDAHEHLSDGRELQLDPDALAKVRVAPTLTFATFVKLYRALRHLALLHTEILAAIPGADSEALQNS